MFEARKEAVDIFNDLQVDVRTYKNPFDCINLAVDPKKSISLIESALIRAFNEGLEAAAEKAENYHYDSKKSNCRPHFCYCSDSNIKGTGIARTIRALKRPELPEGGK